MLFDALQEYVLKEIAKIIMYKYLYTWNPVNQLQFATSLFHDLYVQYFVATIFFCELT